MTKLKFHQVESRIMDMRTFLSALQRAHRDIDESMRRLPVPTG